MTHLLVATRSRGKQAEFRELLGALPFTVVFPDDVGLAESPDEDMLEVHDTFEANARAKAQWFATRTRLASLADDSGLEVDALGGAPGVYSKRYAGLDGPDHVVADANNTKLLAALAGVADPRRTARYRGVLVLAHPGGNEHVASGTTEGRIAYRRSGSNGFGYDPLFIADEIGTSFGEATAEQKDTVSHRARAVRALAGMLSSME